MIQMYADTVKIVGPKGTGRASCLPFWVKHEMINDQLASSIKEVGESLFSRWTIKGVFLLNLGPGQFPSLLAQLIPQPCEVFLFRQKTLASSDPLGLGDYFMIFSACCDHTFLVSLGV